MDLKKVELIQKMEEKGMTVPMVAEAIEFNPEILSLYLIKDAYPVPKRVLEKIASVVMN